jgi:hypothetical protein
MKFRTRITLIFLVLRFFIITPTFLGAHPLENDLRLISRFHSESLYSIKFLNTKLNGAVKESFAYVVASDTYEQERFLKREEHFKKIRKSSFPLPSKLLMCEVKLEKKKEPYMTR